jgi:hypothetical protein
LGIGNVDARTLPVPSTRRPSSSASGNRGSADGGSAIALDQVLSSASQKNSLVRRHGRFGTRQNPIKTPLFERRVWNLGRVIAGGRTGREGGWPFDPDLPHGGKFIAHS